MIHEDPSWPLNLEIFQIQPVFSAREKSSNTKVLVTSLTILWKKSMACDMYIFSRQSGNISELKTVKLLHFFFLSKLLPRAEVPGVLSEAPGTENPGKMFFNPHIISKVPCSLRLHLPVQGLPALARNQSCLHETPQWEVQHWVLLGLTPAKWQFLRHVFLPFCPAILYVETGQVQNTLIAKSRHNDSAGVKGGLSQVVVRAPSNVCTAITGQKAANKWKCEKLDLEHPTNT